VDDQVIVLDSEDSAHKLETVTSKYGKKNSTRKMRTMAFTGRDPVCSDKEQTRAPCAIYRVGPSGDSVR
jgi:hypothetical protein